MPAARALLKLMNIEKLLLVNEERNESLMPAVNNMLADREEGEDWKRGTDEEEP